MLIPLSRYVTWHRKYAGQAQTWRCQFRLQCQNVPHYDIMEKSRIMPPRGLAGTTVLKYMQFRPYRNCKLWNNTKNV